MSTPLAPSASVGTLESNDILVIISAAATGGKNKISLDSTVRNHFGSEILSAIESGLERSGLTGVHVQATDKGALDYTIRARMETAARRYKELAS